MTEYSNIGSADYLKSLIYTVRGVKIMLDADLAVLYGYTTRTFNQQVKNNIAKFDDDFRFQLTKEEYQFILRSKNLTLGMNIMSSASKENDNNNDLMSKNLTSSWGGTRKLPYAFTEQGIYMLMTVLKGELATRQSKALIRAFKEMKDFIVDNLGKGLRQSDYADFCNQYPTLSITFRQTCGIFHDRYIILDYNARSERIYHCGTSSKDAGNKVNTIIEVKDKEVYHPIVDILLDNPLLSL